MANENNKFLSNANNYIKSVLTYDQPTGTETYSTLPNQRLWIDRLDTTGKKLLIDTRIWNRDIIVKDYKGDFATINPASTVGSDIVITLPETISEHVSDKMINLEEGNRLLYSDNEPESVTIDISIPNEKETGAFMFPLGLVDGQNYIYSVTDSLYNNLDGIWQSSLEQHNLIYQLHINKKGQIYKAIENNSIEILNIRFKNDINCEFKILSTIENQQENYVQYNGMLKFESEIDTIIYTIINSNITYNIYRIDENDNSSIANYQNVFNTEIFGDTFSGFITLPILVRKVLESDIVYDNEKKSLALGENVEARGLRSFAFGKYGEANGDYSFAFGVSSTNQYKTIAGGEGVKGSIAYGQNCKATNNYSIATGIHCLASGEYSIAAGDDSRATGRSAIAIGSSTKATSDYEIAFGNYNISGQIFSIGNGTSDVFRSNVFSISNDKTVNFIGNLAKRISGSQNKDNDYYFFAEPAAANSQDLSFKNKLEIINNEQDTDYQIDFVGHITTRGGELVFTVQSDKNLCNIEDTDNITVEVCQLALRGPNGYLDRKYSKYLQGNEPYKGIDFLTDKYLDNQGHIYSEDNVNVIKKVHYNCTAKKINDYALCISIHKYILNKTNNVFAEPNLSNLYSFTNCPIIDKINIGTIDEKDVITIRDEDSSEFQLYVDDNSYSNNSIVGKGNYPVSVCCAQLKLHFVRPT